MDSYLPIYENLTHALSVGYRDQLGLVRAVDEAFAYLQEHPDLPDEQVTGLRMLLAQAESQLGRYFGM